MNQEEYERIKLLAETLYDELLASSCVCDHESIDQMERHDSWYLLFLALSNFKTMEL